MDKYQDLAVEMIKLSTEMNSLKTLTPVEKGRSERLLRRARLMNGNDGPIKMKHYREYLSDLMKFRLEFENRKW